jgi:hypothetical protein
MAEGAALFFMSSDAQTRTEHGPIAGSGWSDDDDLFVYAVAKSWDPRFN